MKLSTHLSTAAVNWSNQYNRQMTAVENDPAYFADRMRWIMQRYKLNKKEIAEKCGIPPSTFNRYVDSGTLPTVENLERIATTFNELNLEWLVMGKGEPIKQPASADDMLRERYAFALDKIHILEDSIQLYKKLIEQNDKHN